MNLKKFWKKHYDEIIVILAIIIGTYLLLKSQGLI